MNTHADKTQENKSLSVSAANSQMQSVSESTFQFVDNRPAAVVQRKLQEMVNNSPQVKRAAQLQAMADNYYAQQQQPIQRKENNTGLPDNLKTGIENISGFSMDYVKVHYNSEKPAQLQAHAYAQGTDIHLASGQEKHLPHEAWHVVQQMQGRVKPTMQFKGKVNVNDDKGLEKEADIMADRVLKAGDSTSENQNTNNRLSFKTQEQQTIQRLQIKQKANSTWIIILDIEDGGIVLHEGNVYRWYLIEGNITIHVNAKTGEFFDGNFEPLFPKKLADLLIQYSNDNDDDHDKGGGRILAGENNITFIMYPICTCSVINEDVEIVMPSLTSPESNIVELDSEEVELGEPSPHLAALLQGGWPRDVAQYLYSFMDQNSLDLLAQTSLGTRGMAIAENSRRRIREISAKESFTRYYDKSGKEAKEKCLVAAQDIENELKSMKLPYRWCGVMYWNHLGDSMPSNHYVILVYLDGREFVIDPTFQQFNTGPLNIVPFSEWLQNMMAIVKSRPAKLLKGSKAMVKSFSGGIYSPTNYWHVGGIELNPVNDEVVLRLAKKEEKEDKKQERLDAREMRNKKVRKTVNAVKSKLTRNPDPHSNEHEEAERSEKSE